MREKFNLKIMILVFVVLASLACALPFVSSSSEPNEPNFEEMEMVGVPSFGPTEIRDPEIALQYGITGYLEITYPSDSPSLLSVDRGGEININILLHFVSYTPEVTEVQVNIDPMHPWGPRIEYRDVIFNEFVSYNLSGNIVIKAGQTVPVMMTIRIPENLPSYIEAIPLCGMGIRADITIDELGGKEVAVH